MQILLQGDSVMKLAHLYYKSCSFVAKSFVNILWKIHANILGTVIWLKSVK